MRTVLYIIIGLVLQHTICAQSNYLYHIGKKDSVYSNILNEYRDIYVQLPYSYNANSNEKYPVIYILDGDVLFKDIDINLAKGDKVVVFSRDSRATTAFYQIIAGMT